MCDLWFVLYFPQNERKKVKNLPWFQKRAQLEDRRLYKKKRLVVIHSFIPE